MVLNCKNKQRLDLIAKAQHGIKPSRRAAHEVVGVSSRKSE